MVLHTNHAVVVIKPYNKKPEMQVINSWGASDPIKDITEHTSLCHDSEPCDKTVKKRENGLMNSLKVPSEIRSFREKMYTPSVVTKQSEPTMCNYVIPQTPKRLFY